FIARRSSPRLGSSTRSPSRRQQATIVLVRYGYTNLTDTPPICRLPIRNCCLGREGEAVDECIHRAGTRPGAVGKDPGKRPVFAVRASEIGRASCRERV